MASCFSPNFIISHQTKMDIFLLGKKEYEVVECKNDYLVTEFFPNRLTFMMDHISKLIILKEQQSNIRIYKYIALFKKYFNTLFKLSYIIGLTKSSIFCKYEILLFHAPYQF